ncbi:N-acetylmannosamine-6-phosphate 2-epimerase [Salinicoccus hispanicus]|uniref:Putative N-acetylmannosamine-6-phosphate 2-epimerase n=1 Tax=Salinicoccus hispanicus TaxID=157225 RepID=A0A6N8U602_9STAP|nr:N-acetylmannosamine-6-phosphate 2-epimerase [Salinicoccus hispanicus]MXQ51049.1 putative N-acetylmannosamine-6-phosphate 2-epimerase [Salinicoccus hispanicus]
MYDLQNLKGSLIVSCQALEDEPLHSSHIMSKMALAASQGGAKGIRANTVKDIKAIKKEVDLPIIGIIKRDFEDSGVYITPTMEEVDALVGEGMEIVALDATKITRPEGSHFVDFFARVKEKYPEQIFMADVSTVEEGIEAEKAGVNIVATTLVGYTEHSEGDTPLETLQKMVEVISVPVIAEGNMDTPEKAAKALELGAYAVVVGSAITRPQLITEKFVKAL